MVAEDQSVGRAQKPASGVAVSGRPGIPIASLEQPAASLVQLLLQFEPVLQEKLQSSVQPRRTQLEEVGEQARLQPPPGQSSSQAPSPEQFIRQLPSAQVFVQFVPGEQLNEQPASPAVHSKEQSPLLQLQSPPEQVSSAQPPRNAVLESTKKRAKV